MCKKFPNRGELYATRRGCWCRQSPANSTLRLTGHVSLNTKRLRGALGGTGGWGKRRLHGTLQCPLHGALHCAVDTAARRALHSTMHRAAHAAARLLRQHWTAHCAVHGTALSRATPFTVQCPAHCIARCTPQRPACTTARNRAALHCATQCTALRCGIMPHCIALPV